MPADCVLDASAVLAVLFQEKGSQRVEPLLPALKYGNAETNRIDLLAPAVRTMAAWALGRIKDPRAVEPLLGTLKDSDPRARASAAIALGNIKDTRAVGPLQAALNDSDEGVHRAVAWALGEIK